jgi:hypothetical protein
MLEYELAALVSVKVGMILAAKLVGATSVLKRIAICRWLKSSINVLNRRSPNVSLANSNHLHAIKRSEARAAGQWSDSRSPNTQLRWS